jgi:putative endonuclease
MIGVRRRGARERGHAGEQRALDHLERAGLTCVGRNFLARGGEIDLVMRDADVLVFVEVRQRADRGFGSALDSITATKRRRIVRAALQYLQRNGEQPCRFDVVVMDGAGRLQWIRDAFRADD